MADKKPGEVGTLQGFIIIGIAAAALFGYFTLGGGGGGGGGSAPAVPAVLSGDHNFKIVLEGSGAFSGSIMVMKGGQAQQRSVEGTAPTEYTESGTMVSVSFQKKQESGTLRCFIQKDGTVAGDQSTSAAYGVVTLATQ